MTFRLIALDVERRLVPYAVTAPRYPRRLAAVTDPRWLSARSHGVGSAETVGLSPATSRSLGGGAPKRSSSQDL